MKKKYGLSLEQYEAMLAAQGGVCAVCGEPPADGKRLAVDHDHTTGRVRSLLDDRCNVAIGMALDSPERLRSLADYLDSHAYAN